MKYCPICTTDFAGSEDRCPTDGARLIDKDQWAPATVIRNKYRILNCIGRGGMGVVYKAEHLVFKDIWALKVMNPRLSSEPEFVRRFYFEAEKQRKLKHPNVVRVDDVDQAEDGRLFIGMEYVDGMGLRDMMQAAQGPLAVGLAVDITRGVASALESADALGIVHRDIKPDNVLLERTGSGFIPKLTDFGVAKLREGTAQMSKAPLLTPQYAAPEQWQPQADQPLSGRTDLYALGMTFYELVAGRLPFQATQDREWMYAHLNQEPPPPSHFNPALAGTGVDEVILRLLVKEVSERTASATELIRELTLIAAPALAPRIPTPAWAEPTRRVAAAASAAPSVAVKKESQRAPAASPRLSSHAVLAPTRPTDAASSARRTPARFREETPRPPVPVEDAAVHEPLPSHGRRIFWWGTLAILGLGAAGGGFWYLRMQPAAPANPEPAASAAPVVSAPATAPPGRAATAASSQPTASAPAVASGEAADAASRPPTEPFAHALTGHTDAVGALAFSPRGLRLASGSDDQSLKLWELASGGRSTRTLSDNGYIHSVSFSPDGRLVAAGDSSAQVVVWQVANGKPVYQLSGHQDQVEAVAFNPANGHMLASGSDDKTVRIWNLATQAAAPVLTDSAGVEAIAFSADGRWLASGADDQSVTVWRVGAWGAPAAPSLAGPGIVRAVAFDPQGRWLAAGGEDGSVMVWDAGGSWRPAAPALRAHRGLVTAVAFSPDGRWLASGGGDSTVRVWDTSTWKLYVTLPGPGGGVRTVAFSPDGGVLAAGGGDHTIELWRRPAN